MSPAALEQLLKDFPRHARRIKQRSNRQVWRFELDGKGYYLKFYPRHGAGLKRLARGNPALREFNRLTALQKAGIPAPRAVAQLVGFTLENIKGDAVILEAIEPSTPLDQYLNEFQLAGEPIPRRRELAAQLRHLLRQLDRAGLGHDDLHLGNFLIRGGEIFLLDGYAVRYGGLTLQNLMGLGQSLMGIATRTELQRGWDELGPPGRMPRFNPTSRRIWRKQVEKSRGENESFGILRDGPWRGIFFKKYKYPRRWSPASRLLVTAEDWRREWPRLLKAVESDQLTPIKRSASGDVLAGEIVLGNRPMSIIVKRPYKRYWYRYANEIGRGSRARRAWHKAWTLIARDVPTAWPLLVMQKRQFGYITDSILVLERVEGSTLAAVDLDAIAPPQRDMLFRRAGTILRRIESFGFAHFDAKSSNWIVLPDDKLGPRPVLIDVDGVRFRRWRMLGINRLLRAMEAHPQYSPADSLALCQGYAPFSPQMVRKAPAQQPPAEEMPEDGGSEG